MKENWNRTPGMPPRYVEVLDRQVLFESPNVKQEQIYIEGSHPHLGHPQAGWSGCETVVTKMFIHVLDEGEEYWIERLIKDF